VKLEKTKIELDVYGTVYNLSRPSFKQALDLKEKNKDKSEEEANEIMLEFLESLGLPKNVTMDMEVDHVTQILDVLMPSKKK
jgi:hypothetical protein